MADSELIERLAEEAGFEVIKEPGMENRLFNGDGWLTEELRRFAALVAEECAEACLALRKEPHGWNSFSYTQAVNDCDTAIRALFKEPK